MSSPRRLWLRTRNGDPDTLGSLVADVGGVAACVHHWKIRKAVSPRLLSQNLEEAAGLIPTYDAPSSNRPAEADAGQQAGAIVSAHSFRYDLAL